MLIAQLRHLSIPCSNMKKILNQLQEFGKVISQSIVKLVLAVIYLLVIGMYSLFIKFSRQIIRREHIYNQSDCDDMF